MGRTARGMTLAKEMVSHWVPVLYVVTREHQPTFPSRWKTQRRFPQPRKGPRMKRTGLPAAEGGSDHTWPPGPPLLPPPCPRSPTPPQSTAEEAASGQKTPLALAGPSTGGLRVGLTRLYGEGGGGGGRRAGSVTHRVRIFGMWLKLVTRMRLMLLLLRVLRRRRRRKRDIVSGGGGGALRRVKAGREGCDCKRNQGSLAMGQGAGQPETR